VPHSSSQQAVNVISGLKFKEETGNVLYLQQVGMVLNFGTVRKLDSNTYKVLECVAGEVWRRTFGPILSQIMKRYIESRRKGASYK
jgi:hypothetical protein